MKITIQAFGGSGLHTITFVDESEMYKVYYNLLNCSMNGKNYEGASDTYLLFIPHNVLRTSIITCFKKEKEKE